MMKLVEIWNINELAGDPRDWEEGGDDTVPLDEIARIISAELGGNVSVTPGKNKKQPSFLIVPQNQLDGKSIRIWSVTNPRTLQPFPTYNTILFVDKKGQHVERAKLNTPRNARATARLLRNPD